MNKNILTIAAILLLNSCSITTQQVKDKSSYIRVSSYLVSENIIEKTKNKESIRGEIASIVSAIKNIDSIKDLTPSQFKELISNLSKSSESNKIVDSIYLIYKDEFSKIDDTSSEKISIILKAIAEGLELSVSS